MADPKRKALMKPFELLGVAALFGAFVAFIIVYTTRNWDVALIAGGGTFVVAVVVLAMLVLSYKPNAPVVHYLDRFEDDAERTDVPADDGEADEHSAVAQADADVPPVAEQEAQDDDEAVQVIDVIEVDEPSDADADAPTTDQQRDDERA